MMARRQCTGVREASRTRAEKRAVESTRELPRRTPKRPRKLPTQGIGRSPRIQDSIFDVRRFRPNLLLSDTDASISFPEQEWRGRRIQIGDVVLRVTVECPRCVMTTHGFEDLPKDPGIMRALVREAGGNLGVYATVDTPGPIKVGDSVRLLD